MNIESKSRERLGLRLSGLFLGIIVLIWLPIEEQNLIGVLVISGAICFWGALWILVKPVEGDNQVIMRHSLFGLGAGLAIPLLAITLMALKSGIHGHGTPDYSVPQMGSVLTRTPFFAISGLLVGLGSGFWRIARGRSRMDEG